MENFSDIGLMHQCWRVSMIYSEYVMKALEDSEYIHSRSTYNLYCLTCDEYFEVDTAFHIYVEDWFKL